MSTASIITTQTISEDGLAKLASLESELQEVMEKVTDPAKEIDQQTMLNLQRQMQLFTLFVQTIASIQKEFSDMLKGIVAKF